MNLSPEQIAALLEEAKPDIIKGLRDEIVNQTKWQVSRDAGNLVRDEIVKFVSNEIIPEVQKQLIESKAGLIALTVPLTEAIMTKLAESLVAELNENLKNSWQRQEILKALFK